MFCPSKGRIGRIDALDFEYRFYNWVVLEEVLLQVKLSLFHKQMLFYWSLFYRHSFPLHKYFLGNNSDTRFKTK